MTTNDKLLVKADISYCSISKMESIIWNYGLEGLKNLTSTDMDIILDVVTEGYVQVANQNEKDTYRFYHLLIDGVDSIIELRLTKEPYKSILVFGDTQIKLENIFLMEILHEPL